MSPLVSIGIPVYNGERYLSAAIASIRAQSVTDIEILLADNGSTDGTRDICLQAAAEDSRVRYLRSETNLGGPMNSNRLVHAANAPLFKWAYHDDTCGPDLLADCLDLLESSPEAVLACPRVKKIDEAGNVLFEHDDAELGLDDPEPHLRLRRIFQTMPEQALFGVIRSDALRKTHLVQPYLSDGYILMSELAMLGPFVQTDSQEQYVRNHPQQHGNQRASQFRWINAARRRDRVFAYSRVTRRLLRAVDDSHLDRTEKSKCRRVIYRDWTLAKWRSSVSDLVHLPEDLRSVAW